MGGNQTSQTPTQQIQDTNGYPLLVAFLMNLYVYVCPFLVVKNSKNTPCGSCIKMEDTPKML